MSSGIGRPGGLLVSVPSLSDAITTLTPSPMKLRPVVAPAPPSNQNARTERRYRAEKAAAGSTQRSRMWRMTRWRIP